MTRITMTADMQRRMAPVDAPLTPVQLRRLRLGLRILGAVTALFGVLVILARLAP